MPHGIGHLPSTTIKQGKEKAKKEAANKKKVAENAKKVEANRKKVAENKAKVRINKADIELAKFYKKIPKSQTYLKSGGSVKKAQMGQSVAASSSQPNLSRKQNRAIKYTDKMRNEQLKRLEKKGTANSPALEIDLKNKNATYGNTAQKDIINERADSTISSLKKGTLLGGNRLKYNPGIRTSSAEMKKGGATGDKNWIQKAVNPKHKGYCTPMTKPTCTPKRKALAKTFKAMAKKR